MGKAGAFFLKNFEPLWGRDRENEVRLGASPKFDVGRMRCLEHRVAVPVVGRAADVGHRLRMDEERHLAVCVRVVDGEPAGFVFIFRLRHDVGRVVQGLVGVHARGHFAGQEAIRAELHFHYIE